MGKRKDTVTEEELPADGEVSFLSQPAKKHKKHKHKKHKKKKSEGDSLEGKMVAFSTPPKEENLDASTRPMSPSQLKATLATQSTSGTPPKSLKKKRKGKDSGSSDEERWLDAIESGKLEEVDDELKKIKPKDPKLMTARQRAMLERKTFDREPNTSTTAGGEQLLALPTGYREKVMTPEMALKAQLKSQKRKQQADEKREKDKKKTMERLLRKQESKPAKAGAKSRPLKRQMPSVILCNSQTGISITLPPGMDFPLSPARAKEPPSVILCGVAGCSNPKRYCCSSTGVPLCSLQCYRKNLNSCKGSRGS